MNLVNLNLAFIFLYIHEIHIFLYLYFVHIQVKFCLFDLSVCLLNVCSWLDMHIWCVRYHHLMQIVFCEMNEKHHRFATDIQITRLFNDDFFDWHNIYTRGYQRFENYALTSKIIWSQEAPSKYYLLPRFTKYISEAVGIAMKCSV